MKLVSYLSILLVLSIGGAMLNKMGVDRYLSGLIVGNLCGLTTAWFNRSNRR